MLQRTLNTHHIADKTDKKVDCSYHNNTWQVYAFERALDLHVGRVNYVAVMYGTRGGLSPMIGFPAKSDLR